MYASQNKMSVYSDESDNKSIDDMDLIICTFRK